MDRAPLLDPDPLVDSWWDAERAWDDDPSGPRSDPGFVALQVSIAQGSGFLIARETAALWAACAAVLACARSAPEVFVADLWAKDSDEFAVRAAVEELATALSMAPSTVRALADQAETLMFRTPNVWAAFRNGLVSVANARYTAELADTLPDDAPTVWARFDADLVEKAQKLAPARYRARARTVRERVHPTVSMERHEDAVETRNVEIDYSTDGMGWLGAYLPAERLRMIEARLDAATTHLLTGDGETRTRNQVRADVLADILTTTPDGVPAVSVSVGVLVPILTLLGGDQPATLEGVGPIDPDTARRLAGNASSFHRILTHPVTGTVLDIDRTSYRVPADLKRWVRLRDQECLFPGCGRLAASCDLDHETAYADGGVTSAENLGPLCENHHRIKHNTRWKLEKRKGKRVWISPADTIHDLDPPF